MVISSAEIFIRTVHSTSALWPRTGQMARIHRIASFSTCADDTANLFFVWGSSKGAGKDQQVKCETRFIVKYRVRRDNSSEGNKKKISNRKSLARGTVFEKIEFDFLG